MASERETIEVRFARDPAYRVYPAVGAWGGLSPNGEVHVDFYVEKRLNPKKVILEIEEGKQVGETRDPNPQPFLRECLFGLVVRPDVARSIGEFLIGLADKVEKRKAQE